MKTKLTLATLALVVGLGFLCLTGRLSESSSTTAVEQSATPPAAVTFTETMTGTPGPLDAPAANEIVPLFYQTLPGAASLHAVESRFETTDLSEFPALLAELERMPESPVKEAMLREALTKWATLDGAAAATWAKLRGDSRRFLPDILQAWAGTGAESAEGAWAFAKAEFSTDSDDAAWLAPGFVTSAFREMTAIPDEAVWAELAGLSGAAASAAMLGMADFASNRRGSTEFAAGMEQRVLDSGSAPLAAAFYAGAGHIAAAKEELTGVTDNAQWHAIAREVARQQAEFEPAKAMAWLEAQFAQPADAIADIVESIGLMHALNAEDVLNWLGTLPESEARTAGMEKLEGEFPQLRVNLTVEVISLKGEGDGGLSDCN